MHAMTVLGSVQPEALGRTLAHEHLLIDLRGLWEPPPPARAHLADAEPTLENRGELSRDAYDSRANLRLDDVDLAVAEAARARAAGAGTLVDVTNRGIGPRPAALRTIAERTGLHIVAGCGFYRARCLPEAALSSTTPEIEDILFLAVTRGIDDSGIRAGILGELGTSDPIHPFEESQLRAAARVSRRTGAAICVHPAIWGHQHLRILDLLDDGGADLSRVILSHCDELVEPDLHAEIARRGAVVSFDTFGSESTFDRDGTAEPRDSERIDCLLRLLGRGFGDRVVLSQDVCTKLQLRRYGGYGYDHLLSTVVPLLERRGVGEGEIEAMLVGTPRRLLSLPGEG